MLSLVFAMVKTARPPAIGEKLLHLSGAVQPQRPPFLSTASVLLNVLQAKDRIYKIVFVGDSGTGKTCFLHRFCYNKFRPLFNTTIGVDFTIQKLRVGEQLVVLQLWDTAGHERFGCLTNQYLRKADAIIIVYDVNSHKSFVNVRDWLERIRLGVDDSIVVSLVANKVDLMAEQSRCDQHTRGTQLAKEFDMLYHETSAFTGFGIVDCMTEVSKRLLQRDDESRLEALKLRYTPPNNRQRQCCA